MLKLIIADDERVIRETISQLIDWNSIGLELVGLCKDGIEAYNMILDESPDIVLTDIKMPGLNGLELVEKISQTDLDTQFIILSGFGEFSFAKEAMKYGIRHYLLKPCNEEQIISSMREVMTDYYHRRAFQKSRRQHGLLMDNLHNAIISSLINEGISKTGGYDELFQPYEHLWDFTNTAYELYYLYYLEEENLQACLESIGGYFSKNAPGIRTHIIYVKNTLVMFFQDYRQDYSDFNRFMDTLNFSRQSVRTEYKRMSFLNLSALMTHVLDKISRYPIIYCMDGQRAIPTCNYGNLILKVKELTAKLTSEDHEILASALAELTGLLQGIGNTDFLKQLAAGLFIKISVQIPACSPIMATEFLLDLNNQTQIDALHRLIAEKLNEIFSEVTINKNKYSDFIEKTFWYIEKNLSDPNLTLKWIAENHLYMNVDYVSKKFIKETGSKFSKYLTDVRIQKAKELLTDCDNEKIHHIAEQVGCGNNPQYFSQIFKKHTGMTPSTYAKMMNGE